MNPFADVAGTVGSLVDRVVGAFGILAPLVPIGYWRHVAASTGPTPR